QWNGWFLHDGGTLGGLVRGCEGPCDGLMIVRGVSTFPNGIHLINSSQPTSGTSAQFALYLMDVDGPGQHRKLIEAYKVPIDGLAYQLSTTIPGIVDPTGETNLQWMEASFTGPNTQGPPLAMPLRIDVGNRVDFRSVQNGADQSRIDQIVNGKRWRVDGPYFASPPGMSFPSYGYVSLDPPKRRPGDLLTAELKGDGSLFGSFRGGPAFRYVVDLPNGTYWVDLGFQESNFEDYAYQPVDVRNTWGVGTRVMNIKAQGMTVLSGLDVFAQAGGNFRPLWKSFPVTVSTGRLQVDFVSTAGVEAMVNAVAVCPLSMVIGGRCP